MRTSAAQVWEVVRAERRRLVLDLSGLGAEEWRTASLCPGWDIHDVVAHLVDSARTGRLSFVRDLVAARMDFDRANQRGVAREKRPDPEVTLEALGAVVDLTRTPPANLATRLVEVVVHGEDVRRPLGIAGAYPEPAVLRALAYQLRTPVSFGGGRERAAGLRLVDRRTGRAWGDGAAVTAGALDLLLAISGRSVPRERFDGVGASRLVDAAEHAPVKRGR